MLAGRLSKLSIFVVMLILAAILVWLYKGQTALDVESLKDEIKFSQDLPNELETSLKDINFDVFALAPQDQTAVLKYLDDSMIAVRVGDLISSSNFQVEQITHDKVVIKDVESRDQYFIYIESTGDRSRVHKVSNTIDMSESLPVNIKPTRISENKND